MSYPHGRDNAPETCRLQMQQCRGSLVLIKLRILAAALRMRTFTIAELARASNVPEGTVHTVFQRIPSDWFDKIKVATGARGGQPYRLALTAAGAAGIGERLGKLPSSEPLSGPWSEDTREPMGIATARASLAKVATAASPDVAEELRQAALHSLDWAAAELDDGDFATEAETLRAEIQEIRRQLVSAPSKRSGSRRIREWPAYIASRLRRVAGLFEGYRASPGRAALASNAAHGVFISYFGSDTMAREVATFAANLATRSHLLSHDRTEPFEAHELLSMGDLTVATPRQLFLCVSAPSASEELQLILKHARLLMDKHYLTRESWVLDCGYNEDVERVTKGYELNYEPHAREFSHLARWANLILANAGRSPLSPGAMPFKDDVDVDDKVPAARLTIKKLPTNAFQNWTTRHEKGTTIQATVSKVDANGATINLGEGVHGYLKASELSTKPIDARSLLKVHQKLLARYTDSDRRRRTITVLVSPGKAEISARAGAIEQSDNFAAQGISTKKIRSKSRA